MENPVLKPGGFWICPTCGQRNKVWAPCAGCGTALAGMAYPEAVLAGGEGARTATALRGNGLLYVMFGAGVLTAVGLGVVLAHLLGSAALEPDQLPGGRPRAAATPVAPPPVPPPLPTPAPRAPTPLPDVLPAPPPAAVYTPSVGAPSSGYSIPAPTAYPTRPRGAVTEPREGPDVRARQQAVRAALARFQRSEEALAAAEGGDPERETEALERLDQAARDLREAEAALDRARQRRPPAGRVRR